MAAEARRVMLAESWTDGMEPTGWWMSEKLDGVRAYWDGQNFYSRQGNLFKGAPDFFKAFRADTHSDLPKTPLDGELWCGRGLFQKCVGIVKRWKNVNLDDWKFITYLVFDAPAHKGKYEERVAYLKTVIKEEKKTTYAAVVGVEKCKGKDHLKQMLEAVEKVGGEGLMLRQPGSSYVHSRCRQLLKVKTFRDDEAKVVGYEWKPGTKIMKHLACVMASGIQFDIGTGFSEAERRAPPKVGAIVTFKYQELSASGKPRFPAFLRIRTDVTWDDVCKEFKKKPEFKQALNQKKQAGVLKKTHTIMFSIVPTRDQASGEKMVTDDNDGSLDADDGDGTHAPIGGAASSNKAVDGRTKCKYGEMCYQTNEVHVKGFWHPPKKSTVVPAAAAAAAKVDDSKKMPCYFGAKCALTNAYHLKTYSHPSAKEAAALLEKEEEEEDNVMGHSDQDNDPTQELELTDDTLPLGPSPAKKEKERPACVYGTSCTRKNADHWREFSHPIDAPKLSSSGEKPIAKLPESNDEEKVGKKRLAPEDTASKKAPRKDDDAKEAIQQVVIKAMQEVEAMKKEMMDEIKRELQQSREKDKDKDKDSKTDVDDLMQRVVGNKKGSSDEEAQPAAPAAKSKTACKYGAGCTRKNPQHFIDFAHPK